MATRSLGGKLWYESVRVASLLTGVTLYGVRCEGREHLPPAGPAVFVANHQSHFDPVLVAMWYRQPMSFLARSGLFRPPLGWLIRSLGAIPVERDGLGLDGLKTTLRDLHRGGSVLVFPEATRTPNGQLLPFKPGFATLAQRSRGPVIPVGIAGAYEVWPRNRLLPHPTGSIQIVFGPPIPAEQCRTLDQHALAKEAEQRVRWCVDRAYALRYRRHRATPLTLNRRKVMV